MSDSLDVIMGNTKNKTILAEAVIVKSVLIASLKPEKEAVLRPIILTDHDTKLFSTMVQITSEIMGVSEETILSNSQENVSVFPRQIICYLLRKHFPRGMTLKKLGKLFGGKHHTTIMASVEVIANGIYVSDFEIVDFVNRTEKRMKEELLIN